MRTRLYHHQIFAEHLTGPGHPERPERIEAVEAALEAEAFQLLDRAEAPEGTTDSVLLCHSQDLLQRLTKALPVEGMVRIENDTVISPKSFQAALFGVGAACAGVDDVVSGEASNVFVASRPPGHHAERDTAMGFCLFNQAGIAARHAQSVHGLPRVAIVDWDVHHGNGTQEIFWSDPSVLYASLHQMPLYPGTGERSETGAGNVFNAPLSEGDDGDHFREAFRDVVLPALRNFCPDLIIISAGFDAHHRDPLGGLRLKEDDFDWATGQLLTVADRWSSGRVVSLLEGGYDLVGLANSVSAHVKRLMVG